MGLNCGVIGLPNVGKSTIFQALTSVTAEAANYPFCTIDPNIGIVSVQDERLEKISQYINPQKIIPTTVEFVDIAGLVQGASKGEGLGNQFLGHIRQVDAIVHVVRCFKDDDIIHVNGIIDPVSDIHTINMELALADLESVEKKINALPKQLKSQDKELAAAAKEQLPILQHLREHLAEGMPAEEAKLSTDEQKHIANLNLITLKKTLYLCNVDEEAIKNGNEYTHQVEKLAQQQDLRAISICGKLESEISALESEEEKGEFINASGLAESGLHKLTSTAYQMLGLKTYFTCGEKEVRAWTFKKGMKAPEAAGIIHSDFEKGFIKAEVYHCSDLFDLKSEQKIKEAGRLRLEGRDYVVQDGDVMHFRFNT